MKSKVSSCCGLLLVAAIGCSTQEAAPPPAAQAPAAMLATTAAPPRTAQPVAPRPAPIATAEGAQAGVRVEVTELKRSSGGTLNLKFTLINDSNELLSVSDFADGKYMHVDISAGGHAIGGVHLIDPVGKKKYFVARDAEDGCVCSRLALIPKGERANLWAKFPAPPDEVERISVVIPHFPPLDDVPVGR